MLDSGSGHDLVQESIARRMNAGFREAVGAPSLQTANGIIRPTMTVGLNISELDEKVDMLVLPSTPSVLSLGRRCMEEGYSFVWNAGMAPILITPSGKN